MSKDDGYQPTPQPTTRATSRGQVHTAFINRLRELMERGFNFSEAFRGSGQRKWNVPDDLTAVNLMAIDQLHKPSFDREKINTNYSECFQDKDNMGTCGDVVSLKFQMDYNAAEERAFRFRHATVCRNLAHALARRRAHGDGPTFQFIEREAGDRIRSGAK